MNMWRERKSLPETGLLKSARMKDGARFSLTFRHI